MRSDRSQASLLVVLLLVALHKRERAELRASFRALGRSVRDLRTRKGTPRANSAASRLIKNRSFNHDARYNDFAGETAAGSAGMQPCRRIAWLGSSRRSLHCANILLALVPTRIGSVEPHALETTARTTESTRPESFPGSL